MRKRFICLITALCISGVIISNIYIKASAGSEAAAVGLSVTVSLFIGMLINDMMGGSNYDFGDACRDLIEVTVDSGKKLGEMINWDNYVSGIKIIGNGISDYFAPSVNWYTDMIGSCFEGLSPDDVFETTVQRVNDLILSGDITLGIDDDGNLTVLSTEYCTLLDSVYQSFGVDTNYLEDGTMQRTLTVSNIVNSTVANCYPGWNFVHNFYYNNGGYKISKQYVCYAITDDGNIIISDRWFKLYYSSTVYVSDFRGNYDTNYGGNNGYIGCDPTDNNYVYFNYDGSDYRIQLGTSGTVQSDKSFSYNSVYTNASGISSFSGISDYRNVGIIEMTSYQSFITAYQNSQLTIQSESVAVSETPTEQELKNQGYILPGVTPGINVDGDAASISLSEDGTKTISNVKTGEAEIVETPANVGDLDFPDSNTIIDKFPFSLPFDLYNILTIFVYPEEKPIFKFPIKTTITNGGLNYEVDEEIVIDLTQFQFMGVDIVRLVLRTGVYIGFVLFLIHITPKLIKH